MQRKPRSSPRAPNAPEPYPLPGNTVPEPADPQEVATYVAEMTDELAKMAANAGLETICYLLTLTRLEAENASREGSGQA